MEYECAQKQGSADARRSIIGIPDVKGHFNRSVTQLCRASFAVASKIEAVEPDCSIFLTYVPSSVIIYKVKYFQHVFGTESTYFVSFEEDVTEYVTTGIPGSSDAKNLI